MKRAPRLATNCRVYLQSRLPMGVMHIGPSFPSAKGLGIWLKLEVWPIQKCFCYSCSGMILLKKKSLPANDI